ncbi:hypothetical protein G9C85_00160 [Halorubellus sp. JP-L1]|uniref:hypothetical protein n=1 Tax=Halorubellus sp. JP-L1 TaxID=2715753 RepID=UPI0014099ADD|nr:hypothetical protein [Halorubellus sp. JP-L1]NHN40051.1 hypothetical protein [Halorubellus sp. JP-L1]
MPDLGAIPPVARYAVAAAIILWLAWRTFVRFMMPEDDDDPSVDVGGDWFLFRASGPALVALAAGVAALLVGPDLLTADWGWRVSAMLVVLVGAWGVGKWRNP